MVLLPDVVTRVAQVGDRGGKVTTRRIGMQLGSVGRDDGVDKVAMCT